MDKEGVDMGGRVPEIFVDFSLVGLPTRFRTWMPADQHRALTDGQEIKVYGDAVDPIRARVVHEGNFLGNVAELLAGAKCTTSPVGSSPALSGCGTP